MAITPLSSLPPLVPASPSAPVSPASSPAGANNPAQAFAGFLDQASQLETAANVEAVRLATGDVSNIHQFTAAAAKAQLAVELTSAVRNRAVDAFNEIMRMQV